MTIGFGCLCKDGVVLGADTQLTAVGYHKSYGRKIQTLEGDGFMDAAITYAGSPVFASDFADSLHEEVLGATDSSYSLGAKPIISSVLSRYVESDVNNNHLLIGVRTEHEGGAALFRTSGYSVSFHGIGEPVYIGAGDSSALALALPLISKFGVVSMRHAALVAFVLIEIAKKYVDGCGGETDILMLPITGEITLLRQDVMGEIYNSLAGSEDILGDALSRVFLPSTEAERDEVIQALGKEIKLTGSLLENALKRQGPQTSEDPK